MPTGPPKTAKATPATMARAVPHFGEFAFRYSSTSSAVIGRSPVWTQRSRDTRISKGAGDTSCIGFHLGLIVEQFGDLSSQFPNFLPLL